MNKGIRNLVSKRKRRFKEDGFDLDLSYITTRLIAMGFPAQKLEGVYRNHIDDVYRFLEERHKDHYRIYNLCSEKSYDISRFHYRVHNFPFADHNPPPLIDIQPLCKDMADWLAKDAKNVAVVHCKAGKGRTGVMICCYLLHTKDKVEAHAALDFYGDKRTFDRKGVTIPSQRRYVDYYAKLVNSGFEYNPPSVRLREAKMQVPLSSINSEVCIVICSHTLKGGYSSEGVFIRKGIDTIKLKVNEEKSRPIAGDIKIELRRTNKIRMTEKLFSAWLNTHFIFEEGEKIVNGCAITPSDRNNHNTAQPHRQRSNSFHGRKVDHTHQKHDRHLKKSSNPYGFETEQPLKSCESESSASASQSHSLPTGHLTQIIEEEVEDQRIQCLQFSELSHNSHLYPRQHHHRRRHSHHHLPKGGGVHEPWDHVGEQEVVVILKKEELDKANKDTHHKLLPADFKLELHFTVTYASEANSVGSPRGSGTNTGTVTPSGSSSDTDGEDDDDESDWDSAEGSEVLL